MIYLGLDNQTKDARIGEYCAAHDIRKVFILSPEKFKFACSFPESEVIEWADIIEYQYFYRLLQEIDRRTLVVVNECLRTQNRYDLTYNCIRHFLNQTVHQLIFQYLPLIDASQDFMILFDFDTRSRWKREKFNPSLLTESELVSNEVSLKLQRVEVETPDALKVAYQKEKEKLFASIGLKDPHTLPRNLYLVGGKAKLRHVESGSLFNDGKHYIGRNNRFKIEGLQTYREKEYPHHYTVFEFCHNFIDFADFLSLSRQSSFDVLVADLKADAWYFDRYMEWIGRINECYAGLQRKRECAGSSA